MAKEHFWERTMIREYLVNMNMHRNCSSTRRPCAGIGGWTQSRRWRMCVHACPEYIQSALDFKFHTCVSQTNLFWYQVRRAECVRYHQWQRFYVTASHQRRRLSSKWVWQWVCLFCGVLETGTHIFFACPAVQFLCCFVREALGPEWEALDMTEFLKTRANRPGGGDASSC